MYQYSNEGYREYAPRRHDNSNVYRGPHTGANKEERSMEDAEDYYPTRDTDHYPQNSQNFQVNRRDSGVEAETGYYRGYPEYHERQNSEETEEVTDLDEDNIPQRDTGLFRKIPPKPAPKPRAYFQAQINGANRNRIFSRQESNEYPHSVDGLEHMTADQDLSPPRPPPPSSNIHYPPRERMKSNRSNFDSNKSEQSSGDVFNRSQSAFSNSSRVDLDRSTLDRSTLSARETLDPNKSLYSTKSLTGSVLVNRDAVANSANGTLNQSSLSTRSTTTQGRDARNMIVSPSAGVYRVASRNDVISSRGLYGDANRSILSNQSVQSGVFTEHNKSVISQNYSIGQAKTLTYMQNGAAHPVKETPLDATIRSNANLSRAPSFTLSKTNLFNQSKVINAIGGPGENYGVRDSLASLGLICLISLVLIVLGTQLLFRLNDKQFLAVQEAIGAKNLLLNSQSYESMLEVRNKITVFKEANVIICNFISRKRMRII